MQWVDCIHLFHMVGFMIVWFVPSWQKKKIISFIYSISGIWHSSLHLYANELYYPVFFFEFIVCISDTVAIRYLSWFYVVWMVTVLHFSFDILNEFSRHLLQQQYFRLTVAYNEEETNTPARWYACVWKFNAGKKK